VSVSLNATGKQLLRKLGKLRANLTLTPTGKTKPARTKAVTF
jgi:hypothetical protein